MRTLLLVLLTGIGAVTQAQVLANVPEAFAALQADKPAAKHFTNHHFTAPAGGHLQGIQATGTGGWLITASSGSYSYYIHVVGDTLQSLHKLYDTPYRHAGGCQLAGGKLFTGVEDNLAKDKAKVVAVGQNGSIAVIAQRSGRYKRSTAGATGAVYVNGKYIVAVADWDSRNIDFYRVDAAGYDSVGTFSAGNAVKWGSYQSINLLADTAGNLFMIGFCKYGSHNRADLFEVDAAYKLNLLSSRNFGCTRGGSFRYGAGLGINKNTLMVYTCQRVLKRHNAVNVFSSNDSLLLHLFVFKQFAAQYFLAFFYHLQRSQFG